MQMRIWDTLQVTNILPTSLHLLSWWFSFAHFGGICFFCSLKGTPPKTEVQSGKIPFEKGKSSLKATWLCVQKLLFVSGDVYFVPWKNHHKNPPNSWPFGRGSRCDNPQVLGGLNRGQRKQGRHSGSRESNWGKGGRGRWMKRWIVMGKKKTCGTSSVVVSNILYFHPYLGKISNLTNIFQMGWNHQPEKQCGTSSVK